MPSKSPHHSGPRYTKAAAWIRDTCNADPHAVCRCGLTRNQHPPGANGKPQTWTAGHGIDGSTTWQLWTNTRQPAPPGDWLAPEMSRCNMQRGKQRADTNARGFWIGA